MSAYHLSKSMEKAESPACETLHQCKKLVIPSAKRQWVLWQADFAMHCLRNEKESLTNVYAPLALSAVLAMLLLGGDKQTKAKIEKTMGAPKGFSKRIIESFMPILQELRNNPQVQLTADLFASDGHRAQKEYVELLLELFGSKMNDIAKTGQIFPSRRYSLSSSHARLLAEASTVITAPWDSGVVRPTSPRPFMVSHALKIPEHPYFTISGKFRCLQTRVYEAWMLPLDSAPGCNTKLALILIRPVFVGLLLDMFRRMHGHSLLGLIKRIHKQKEQNSCLLVPKMQVPLGGQGDLPTDLLVKNGEFYGDGKYPEMFPYQAKLDHFFHAGAISLSKSGVGFFNDEEQTPTKPRTSPECFSARFDSPFVFLVVECLSEAPLTIGSYSGPNGVSPSYLSRPFKRPGLCQRRKSRSSNTCAVM
uniref:SERPIN domain-containing protein n=1 Tax=Steinernema glaseri TaxID=37863 RepID=A0A1I7YFX7_9BILA